MAWSMGLMGASAPPVGEVGSYDLLATEILTASAASVTFSGLSAYSSTYKHLQIRGVARSTWTGTIEYLYMKFNSSDLTHGHYLRGYTGSVTSSESTGPGRPGIIFGNGYTSGTYGGFIIDIYNPFNTSHNTTFRSFTGVTGSESILEMASGFLNSTAAIDSITFTDQVASTFAAGSRFSIYGLKAA